MIKHAYETSNQAAFDPFIYFVHLTWDDQSAAAYPPGITPSRLQSEETLLPINVSEDLVKNTLRKHASSGRLWQEKEIKLWPLKQEGKLRGWLNLLSFLLKRCDEGYLGRRTGVPSPFPTPSSSFPYVPLFLSPVELPIPRSLLLLLPLLFFPLLLPGCLHVRPSRQLCPICPL